MLINVEKACLVVVDVQPRLVPAMAHAERVVANGAILMRSAARMNVPMMVSEQYPRGLGHTVDDLAPLVPEGRCFEKVEFSCLADEAFRAQWTALERTQPIVAGIEAHVCVLQTVMDLVDSGLSPFVVADAVSSRTAENAQLAIERMRQAGAVIVSTEMVVFEFLRSAKSDAFKELSALIK